MLDDAKSDRKLAAAPLDRKPTAAPLATRAARPWRLALVTAVLGVVVFTALALLVPRAATDGLDAAVLRTLRQLDDSRLPLGGDMVLYAARDITALGGTVVLMIVVGLVVGYLMVDRRLRDAVAVLAASIGGLLLVVLLKLLFARDRPSIVPHLVITHSASFPSGHSMLSAVIYPTLGALLARFAKRRGTQVLPIAAAIAITFLVGVSRLVLGVHYPTDVLAGWSAGAAWAGFSWLAVDRLVRQGKVEGRENDAPESSAR